MQGPVIASGQAQRSNCVFTVGIYLSLHAFERNRHWGDYLPLCDYLCFAIPTNNPVLLAAVLEADPSAGILTVDRMDGVEVVRSPSKLEGEQKLLLYEASHANMMGWPSDSGVESVALSPEAETDVPPPLTKQKKTVINFVFKSAKGASPFNRKVHAIAKEEPMGRWYSKALCGECPKKGTWGWQLCDRSELSCPKCFARVRELEDR